MESWRGPIRPKGTMTLRHASLSASVLLALALASGLASAQRRRREPAPPPPIEMESATVTWSLFVSAYGESPSSRIAIDAPTSGPIPVPLGGWSCTYGPASRARLDDTTWTELRTIDCTRGSDVVSTSGFCQVVGASWGARAAMLSLGATSSSSRLNLTLDCEVH
jgi:hypothetical protein